MPARLFSPCGEIVADRTFEREVTLGRDPSNSLVLEPDLLSGRHARILWDDDEGAFVLEDLGSSNGTRLDGRRVTEATPLGHLHVITLAERYEFVFQDLDRCALRHGTPETSTDTWPPGAGAAKGTQALSIPLLLPGALRRTEASSAAPGTPEPGKKTQMLSLPLPLPGFLRGADKTADKTAGKTAGKASVPATAHLPPDEEQSARVVTAPAGVPKGSASRPMQLAQTTRWPEDASADPGDGPRWPEVLPSVATGPPALFLEVLVEGGIDRFRLHEGENVVGRGQDADLRIISHEVSRSHAVLVLERGEVRVRDLGSTNKTFVDEVEVTAATTVTAAHALRFGAVHARLRARRTAGDGPRSSGNG